MPKKDLWVGTSDPDPTTVVRSADSCDSMISNDSSQSEKSDSGYDYLSVEEKECLMFLQETLDLLDAEADSGLSTDEAEIAEPSRHPQTWPKRDNPIELDHENLGKHPKNEQKSKKSVSGSVPVTPSTGYYSLPRNVGVRKDPQTNKDALTETAGSNADDPKTLLQFHLNPWRSHKLGTEDISDDQPGKSTLVKTTDLETVVIPPPEPFQDQWRSHFTTGQESPLLDKDSCKDLAKGTPYHFEAKRNINTVEGCEARAAQQQLSSGKVEQAFGKQAVLRPLSPQPNKKITESAKDNYKKPTVEEFPLDSSFKQGPPTAPKPRKLPPNIILKTSKSNVVSLTVDSSHKIKVLSPSNGRPRAATGDFSSEKVHSLQKEQDKARREALEKLGLPQDKEKDPEDHRAKNSALSKSKETPRTSSMENVNTDNIAVNKKPEQQHNQAGEKGFRPMEINVPGIKQANFKSNTLERSGVGLSSYTSSGSEDKSIKNHSSFGKTSFLDKIAPSFLRNNRPRTASLGVGSDFTDLKENRMQNYEVEKSDKRRSYPLQNPAKLPRPPCVSVKITPKGATDEDRKEALKKLGLLKE
uniref:specifically androgen-regulated gene protein n=1 Tax=Euleptes europaea TaxID=460621 RepID=UPI002540E0A1|nr:specifically androgen-regulated gene protein [Euleptes europaea]